ncbi:hypothetical protein HDU76_009558 [Blyttiomyces sp. JEL0837]|nr:hypothetical protein HDU76_009558 [Blyttiomyces sp. JEL0837]
MIIATLFTTLLTAASFVTAAPANSHLVRRANTDVVTLGADPGQNGGNGINNIQCNNGALTATINLLASININNIHAYQPMAELGLPTIAMSFFLNGQPGKVTVQNTFNVGTNSATGNTWTFAINDDGPHPGGQLTLGMCTPGAPLPAVTVSFANVGGPVTVAGLPNGADGGPVVPAIVSGGCAQADMPTFVECTVVDTTTGALSIYNPLVVDGANGKATQAFLPPVVPTLPANSVVGCWFGTNGMTTILKDVNGSLKQGNCVNGAGAGAADVFGQFATCNGAQFFAAVKGLGAKVQVPALGMGKNGKPCYTTRSFEVIDMDQSDNVITTYLLGTDGTIAQNNPANAAALQKKTGKAPASVNNGSDNLLLDALMRPALGCAPFTAPDLANPGQNSGSLALNEIQAAALQAAPIATVPPTDPMVTTGGNPNLTKQNLYRAAVNQAPSQGTTAESKAYCMNMLTVTAPAIITDGKFTVGFMSPDPANGKDLNTFLGQRFEASWTGLGCDAMVPIVPLDGKTQSPIIANRDGNGVTQSLTFNTAELLKLAQGAGFVMGGGAGAGNGGAGTGTATTTVTVTVTQTVTVTAGAGGATTQAMVTKTKTTAKPTVTPPPANFGNTITQTIKTQFQAANCNNGKVTLNILLMISQNGNQPMAENGLPTVTGALTFNGANANIVKVNQGNGVTSAGNTFTFTEQDDGPNVNMAFDTDVACQPNMATTKGFAVAYTAAPVTLNGVTSNVVIA